MPSPTRSPRSPVRAFGRWVYETLRRGSPKKSAADPQARPRCPSLRTRTRSEVVELQAAPARRARDSAGEELVAPVDSGERVPAAWGDAHRGESARSVQRQALGAGSLQAD